MVQAWTLVILAAMTLLLRVGYGLMALGAVRSKNAAGVMCRAVVDTAGSVVAFWSVGAAILLGTGTYFALDHNLLLGQLPETAAVEFFHLSIVCIGGAVVTSALAERSNFYLSLVASVVLAGVVIPVAGHWVWFGWLGPNGWKTIDFGGTTAIHLASAVFAGVGVAVVGSRADKFAAEPPAGHAIPIQIVGVLVLLVGWFPYSLGSTIAHWAVMSELDEVYLAVTATNVVLAAAGGALGGLMIGHLRFQKPDLFYTSTGLLAGLVAISGGAVAVSGGGALTIGFIAGLLVPPLAVLLDTRGRLDDPVGLIAVHGVGGLWGTLASGLFFIGNRTSFAERMHQVMVQGAAAAIVIVWAAVAGLVVFGGCRRVGLGRSSREEEGQGSDLADHAVRAYPEFAGS